MYFQTNLDGVDSNRPYLTCFGRQKSRLFGDSGDGWMAGGAEKVGFWGFEIGGVGTV